MEEWRDIKWYEWKYQVSSLWNVKSLNYKRTKKEKNLIKWYCGVYSHVSLFLKWKCKTISVHRLVGQAFLWLDIENKEIYICHRSEKLINWILSNNVENLFIWNAKSNMKDMALKKRNYSPMLWKFWKDNPNSKKINQYTLNWEFIKEWGWISEASRFLSVSRQALSKCLLKKEWTCKWFKWKFKE
jgi:hypothetical protein